MIKCKYFENRNLPVEYSTERLFPSLSGYFTLALLFNGTAVLEIDNQRCFVSAPALLCLKPQTQILLLKSNKLMFKSIFFDPAFINRNLSVQRILADDYSVQCRLFDFPSFDIFYNIDDAYSGIIPVSSGEIIRLKLLFDEVINQFCCQPDDMWSCRARMNLLMILDFAAGLLNCFDANVENRTAVDCVLEYIEKNFDKKMSIADFCKWNRINRTTLMKEFKACTGKTITDFIIDKRLEVSAQILEFTNLSIDEIAQRCGFSSQSYFCRIFKHRFGATPSAYRKMSVEKRIKAYTGNK